LPLSAADAISPAIEHTKRQLFQPFRLGQWVRLALVGLLAGELGSSGCNTHSFSRHGGSEHFPGGGLSGIDPMLLAGLIAVLVVAALVLGILFMYIGSVMRFVLFDSVLARECHIRLGWSRRQEPGFRYFLWKLLYALVMFGAMIVLIGLPLGFAFVVGWLRDPKEHMVPLVLGGVALFFAFLIFIIGMAVIYVLTKDFVVPQMALEGIGAMEGWSRLWEMMKAEKGGYAGYVGMKIVLAIVVGIVVGIVGLIIFLLILIPVAGVVVAAVVGGKAAGLTWTVGTITLAVVAGCVLLAVLFFLMSLISVPAIVFFPAYSIYFFAARYPKLSTVLYPAQIPPGAIPPPAQPPPLPPAPAPIG
jgi:hypothetical protein